MMDNTSFEKEIAKVKKMSFISFFVAFLVAVSVVSLYVEQKTLETKVGDGTEETLKNRQVTIDETAKNRAINEKVLERLEKIEAKLDR